MGDIKERRLWKDYMRVRQCLSAHEHPECTLVHRTRRRQSECAIDSLASDCRHCRDLARPIPKLDAAHRANKSHSSPKSHEVNGQSPRNTIHAAPTCGNTNCRDLRQAGSGYSKEHQY